MRLHPTALTLMTLMLAACGSGDKSSGGGSGASTTPVATPHDLIIKPALGYVDKANVTVKRLDGSIIGSAVTVNGQVTLTVPAGVDSVLIEVTGGADSKYFEEAANAMQNLPAAFSMRAMTLVSSDKQVVSVTPLTEFAVNVAMGIMGGVHKYSIIQGNDYISRYFDIDNILTPPLQIDELTDYSGLSIESLPSKHAGKYALLLTAASQYASTRTSSTTNATVRWTQEMSADFLNDGIINNTTAVTYSAGNTPNGLKIALQYFRTAQLNPAGVILPTHPSNPALDIDAYYTGFIFKVANRINSADYLTDAGPGVDVSNVTIPRISANIVAGDLLGLTGTFTGKNFANKDCKVTVGNDGSITIAESGVTVYSQKFDGGNEDTRIQTFDSAGVLVSQYLQARSSIESKKSLFAGYSAAGLMLAGVTDEVKDEKTEVVSKVVSTGCYITTAP